MSSKDVIVRHGAGGSPGGLGHFLIGLVMAGVGAYMLTNRINVTTGYWHLWGMGNSFGMTLIPFLGGVLLVFMNGASKLGWLLILAGFAIIMAGILLNLQIYFQRTTLYETLIMFGLIVGGLGLIGKALIPVHARG